MKTFTKHSIFLRKSHCLGAHTLEKTECRVSLGPELLRQVLVEDEVSDLGGVHFSDLSLLREASCQGQGWVKS